ncbi:MAG: Rrf2 family transcriptional regulator [Candidatus Omnitrophica bacterium]|jgi:Rrf2 family protein|nr:Rrf2 family transcriptional regulator [Candidatus Omnitrophota bacterium]
MKGKLITRDTDYAVRALCFMAINEEEIMPVDKLVEELKIPRPFLRKIMQMLNKKGILHSYKGKGGGFALSVSPDRIFLTDLIEVFQGPLKLNECIFKKNICPNINTCPLKKRIDKIEDYIKTQLQSISLHSLLEKNSKI